MGWDWVGRCCVLDVRSWLLAASRLATMRRLRRVRRLRHLCDGPCSRSYFFKRALSEARRVGAHLGECLLPNQAVSEAEQSVSRELASVHKSSHEDCDAEALKARQVHPARSCDELGCDDAEAEQQSYRHGRPRVGSTKEAPIATREKRLAQHADGRAPLCRHTIDVLVPSVRAGSLGGTAYHIDDSRRDPHRRRLRAIIDLIPARLGCGR